VAGLAGRWIGPHWGARSLDGVSPPGSPEHRAQILRLMLPLFVGFIAFGGPAIVLATTTGPAPADIDVGLVLGLMVWAVVGLVPLVFLTAKVLPLWSIHLLSLLADATVVLLALALGHEFSPYAVTLCWVSIGMTAFLVGTRRAGAFHVTVIGACYAFVLAVQTGNDEPISRWLVVMGIILVTAINVTGLVERGLHLAAGERTARESEQAAHTAAEEARADLAELNQTLEAKVTAQVEELERTGELRRFLPEAIADAVLSGDADHLLQPHRRKIAVFFCDLRGFTRFASGAQPEDVVEVLDGYYRTVGTVLRDHGASIGMFAGDGIMAYLNDPVPCDDPAGRAVEMARALREPMLELTARWAHHGHELGYGIGIAYGYATLGIIGFGGRNDYTALGSVVNLAARLCDEAADGEVLLDQRALEALDADLLGAEPLQMALKGFPDLVPAHRIRV
jgi:class 3 adenylate cyclase